MAGWYNRSGEKISMERADELLRDREYCVVQQDTLSDGSMVSTVWIGLDHRHIGTGPPIIFETLWLEGNPSYGERYCTQEEALEGHNRILEEARAELARAELTGEVSNDEFAAMMRRRRERGA